MAVPTQLAFRTLKGIGLLDAAPVYESVPGFERPEGNLRCSAYSPDGRFFAFASSEQVIVVDPSTGHLVTTLPAPSVYELGFSPLGTYIITWQRPSKDEAGDAVKNLKVWRTIDEAAGSDGERDTIGKYVQKSQTGWNLQYTSDERFCARVVTNEVQMYQSDDLGTVWNKLRVEGVTDFAVAPGETHSIAVFVPERKGNPAAVKVFKVPQFDAPVSQKTFFKGDKVQLKWNQLGTSVIVLAQTDVDKSNRSYYGETNLYILSADGGFDSRITLDKEGPIHDVSWSPASKSFGVVYGYMPAKTVIFSQKAEAIHTFPLAPRNTIMFSPHGRFVLVAGFGNLAGQMDIYDLNKDYTKLVTIEASNASVCEWSPDGKNILTATTSPRLRVDNGVRIWHVLGGLMYNEEMSELYEVCWRPQSTAKHPLEDAIKPAPAPHTSALAYLGKVKTPSKPAGAYRPPGARGTSTPLHFKREDEGGAAYSNNSISSTARDSNNVNGFGARKRRDVPGAAVVTEDANGQPLPPGAAPGGGVSLTPGEGDENLSKAALKNKKKREARKNKDKESGVGADAANGETATPERASREMNGTKTQHLDTPSKGQRKDRSRSRPRTARQDRAANGKPSRGDRQQQGAPQQSSNASDAPLTRAQQPLQPPPGLPPLRTSAEDPKSSGRTATSDISVESHSADALGSPHEKKVRSLVKKLRAIEELKMRQAGGEKLELSQVSKIRSEEVVRKELDGLGGGG